VRANAGKQEVVFSVADPSKLDEQQLRQAFAGVNFPNIEIKK
jgi:hypothetical protein